MNPHPTIRRALLSVYDKTGIVEFARALHDEFGVEIISTGGTAKALTEAGVPVTLVETLTGCGEMLGGRVKTLHPAIHAAILADRDNAEHMRQLEAAGLRPIDMVVVNLYPFDKTVADPNCTLEQAIEMIDIGGVALLRAAAKNHRHVWTLSEARRLRDVLIYLRTRAQGWDEDSTASWRAEMAWETLWRVSRYDATIASWLAGRSGVAPYTMDLQALFLEGTGARPPRYGENPHQCVRLLEFSGKCWRFFENSELSLSYNNYLDADAAFAVCCELTRAAAASPALWAGSEARPAAGSHPAGGAQSIGSANATRACVFVKHTNACGAAVAADSEDAYRKAYLADPNAAMGGVLAVNFPVDARFAALVMETYDRYGKPLKEAGAPYAPGGFFVEVWVAPSFTEAAEALIRGTYDPEALRRARATDATSGSGAAATAEPIIETPPKKKWGETVRLLAVGDMRSPPDPAELQYRSIAGGLLAQTPDLLGLNEADWRVVTRRTPSAAEMTDLRLAWLVCKHTKSNAISIVKDRMLIGNGAGQMSRVMSCRIATWLARENGHAERLIGSSAASDAFFPFPDGPRILLDAGATALIQPGGSKRDEDTIKLCDERGVTMIFTGTRHFRH
jgi:phosphoribosylaminoimidazolecarboxamide formyltransferase/IMP cyclohydrolase